MTEIEFLHEMVKAAGGDPDMLKDKLKSTYYECLINCMKNGGGSTGGGGGSSGEYTQPDWGSKNVVAFAETEVTIAPLEEMDGMPGAILTLMNPIPDGSVCNVSYNGETYSCVYYKESMGIGNMSALGGEDTGEPFFIMVGELEGAPLGILMPFTDAGAVVCGISFASIKKIGKDYIEDTSEPAFIDLTSYGLPAISVQTTSSTTCCNITTQQFIEMRNALKKGIVKLYLNHNGYSYKNVLETVEVPAGSLYTYSIVDEYGEFDSNGNPQVFSLSSELKGKKIYITIDGRTNTIWGKIIHPHKLMET
jgi:hypothetical protein